MTGVELPEFKRELDSILVSIPDEPQSPGYTAARQAESNSLVHMIPTIRQGLSNMYHNYGVPPVQPEAFHDNDNNNLKFHKTFKSRQCH